MQEQKRQKEDAEELCRSYQAARKAYAKARARVAGAPSSRSSSSGSGSRSALPLRRAPESTAPQPTIQQYCPPTCHVWRDLGRGAWNSHLEGFRHFSRRWGHYGESGAAWLVLKRGSRLHLGHSSEPLTSCPVAGLFVGDPAKDAGDSVLPGQ